MAGQETSTVSPPPSGLHGLRRRYLPLVDEDFVATPDEIFERMLPPEQWLENFWQKEDEKEWKRRQLWLPGFLDPNDEFQVVGWLQLEYGLAPQGHTRRYVGHLTVEIRRFATDDDFVWLKVKTPAGLKKFRYGRFDEPPHEVPPVLAYTAPIDGRPRTRIGEGRGRINFARAHNMRLHVWCLVYTD